jgi:hypothetical protein
VAFEAMIGGWSIERIAELRKVRPRTIRREIDRTLDERRLDAPDRYAHLQVARLTRELRVADAALNRGDLRAIDPMVQVVRELDRYHGLRAFSRAALPAPRAAASRLPPQPLRLAPAAAPLARRPRKNGGPEAAAATPQTERLNLGARFRGHGCAPRGRFVGTVEVRVGAGRSSEAERNCVAARRGGEQREANWQSVG